MAQIAALTLKDGLAVPANHTFSPRVPQIGTSPAKWLEKSIDSMLGDKAVTLLSDDSGNRGKVTLKLEIPLNVAPSGQPAIYETSFVNISFSLSPNATEQHKKDVYAYANSFLSNSVVKSAVEVGEVVY